MENDDTHGINEDIRNKEGKNKKKRKKTISVIGIIFLSFIVLFTLVYFFFIPKLTLKGEKYIKVEYGNSFKEPGYTASYLDNDITDKAWIEGNVNNEIVGKYKLKYKVRKNKITITKERVVEIVDTVSPSIELMGEKEQNVCPNIDYVEEGYTAIDNYDKNITDKVKIEKTDTEIKYSVEDSSGNNTHIIRKINKVDNTAPVITLKNGDNYYVMINSKYKDPGYTATDNCEGDLTSKVIVEGNVNTNVSGKYNVTYSVEDSNKNKNTVTRVVNVTNEIKTSPEVKGAIYLTFDDGPSATITPKLLDILKEKDVKATFFVINHSSNLDYLIKRAYEEGHTVALHSMTHNYSKIYSSQEAYFSDLKQISDKVERLTGTKSMIIRFPGGGSNTISRNYSKGIMTTLTNEVLNRGYHYFDWNVSSGDAGDVKTTEGVYNNVTKGLSKNKANIVLLHDFENNYKTLNAISDIIDYGKDNGYEFLAIDMSTALVRHKVNN